MLSDLKFNIGYALGCTVYLFLALCQTITDTSLTVSQRWRAIHKYLLWPASLLLIAVSSFRAWNLGFTRETYIVALLCQVIMIFDGYFKNDKRVMMMNGFYFINAAVAIARW